MIVTRCSVLFRFVVFFSLVCLAGCSTFFGKHGVFRGRSGDYLQSGSIKNIELPEGVDSVPLEPLYKIPQVSSADEFGDPVTLDDYKVPRPLPMGDKGEVGVKIQKLSGASWIYLNASTAQVWPRTQYFLSQSGFEVVASNANKGLIETQWVGFKEDQENAARFRLSLEKGIHAETSEIHVLHHSISRAALEAGERPDWPATSSDPEKESWILTELANSLARNVDNNAASLLGQNVGGDLKASFSKYDDEPVLQLNLSRARAWATVSHAAEREGFKTWDENVELGIAYVGYTTYDEEEAGMLSSLAFWSDKKPLPDEAPYALNELMQNLYDDQAARDKFASLPGAAFNKVNLKKGTGYLLVLFEPEDKKSMLVSIRDYRGKKLATDEAKTLLRILRKNLI